MKNMEDLIASLAQDAEPVKTGSHPYILGIQWLGAAAVYLALTLAYSGLRPDLMLTLQAPFFLVEIGLLVAIIITTSLSAAVLSFPDLHQKRRMAYGPVLIFILFVLVIFLAWRADIPPAPHPEHSVKCLIFIASLTLLPAAWMFYSMRNLASTHQYFAGSIALLSAFSLGALSLRLSEPTDSILHVMQWHYLPMVGVGILGLWLGKKLLKW